MTITTTPAPALIESSVAILLAGQSASGALVASPAFPEYHFAWLRDGAYCALALDAVGRRAEADAFHRWAARTIVAQGQRIEHLIAVLDSGHKPAPDDMLPTRYTLDGHPEPQDGESWPNFQLDGYGTWMFALLQHGPGALTDELRAAVNAAARYLEAAWKLPCFDYWEEAGDRQHTSTLAAIAAGLRAASRLLDEPRFAEVAERVLEFMSAHCVADGAFVKSPGDARVDASLLSLATPFGLVAADDPRMRLTTERIRTELRAASGGIRRYQGDSYYGGNPWVLLTAWLGWHDRLAGNEAEAEFARRWVLEHASAEGTLAEQLIGEPQAPLLEQPWIARWGVVADPLLWSHAKFLLLESGAPAAVWS